MKNKGFYHVELTFEGSPVYEESIDTPDEAADFFVRNIGSRLQENLAAIYLNYERFIIGWRIIARGNSCRIVVSPREVFLPAVHLGASSLILAHNHPNERVAPSHFDIEATQRFLYAGKILGISVMDHLVVTHQKYCSLLNQCRSSY